MLDAHFQEPWEIASDGGDILYLADANAIRAIDRRTGVVTTLAGTFGLPGAKDGVGTQATFSLPSGLTFSGGILYLSDTENHLLRQIDVATGMVTTLAGVVGKKGMSDGPADQALLAEPEGIALDASGNLYFSDTDNNAVRVLNLGTRMVSTIAGGGPNTAALTDGVGTAAAFNRPKAMRIDAAGNLYVADAINLAVRKVVPSTGAVTTLATFAMPPQGLAVDGSDLLVSLEGAKGEGSIVRLSAGGAVSPVAGSSTQSGFVDGVGTAARFNWPGGLLLDGSGELFIADSGNFVLREMNVATANVVTFAGAKSLGSADGRGRAARFSAPLGLAADDATVYLADTGNDTIRAIDIATGTVTTLAGAVGQAGRADGPLAQARFNQPQGLAFDSGAKILYVGDALNRVIRQIDLGKGVVSTLTYTNGPGYAGLDGASALALDGSHVYVVDSVDDDVVAIDLPKGEISLVAGQNGTPSAADGVGADAGFYTPTGIAADGRGNLYVADNQSSTLRRIVVSTATVSTIAGASQRPGYRDGVGAMAFLGQPFAVTANGLGDLFFSDSGNNAVRHLAVSTNAVTTVIGTPPLQGVRLGPLPAQITAPSAIALTPGGSLLVVSENSVLIAH